MSPGTSESIRNVIIIGSGPAGYTAAIYTARADLAPLVNAVSVTAGGELMNTTEVENFPGFTEGIMGPDLMGNMQKQVERFGAEILFDDVTHVDLAGDIKMVTAGNGTTYLAHTVIFSTGLVYRTLGVPNGKRLTGHGVSSCATCDGFFFRGQEIAVIGRGDSALEGALFLTKFACKVTVVHRRESLRASNIMADRALAHPKIEFIWNSAVTDLEGEERTTGLQLENLLTGKTSNGCATVDQWQLSISISSATPVFLPMGRTPSSNGMPLRIPAAAESSKIQSPVAPRSARDSVKHLTISGRRTPYACGNWTGSAGR